MQPAQPEVEFLGDTDIPMATATVEQMVDELAGEDGWWHPHNGVSIHEVLTEMTVVLGMPNEVAFGLVASVVGAIHDEHGL